MEKYSLENLSCCIRRMRVREDKTQEQTAIEMGIDHRHYQRLERSDMPNIRILTLFKVLKHYKITLDELLDIYDQDIV